VPIEPDAGAQGGVGPADESGGRNPDSQTDVDRATVLSRLARSVAAAGPAESLPERLALACRNVLEVDATAITLESTTPNRITLWSTDDTAARIEDLQEVTGEGPSNEAFVTGSPVITHLDRREQRWPQFTHAARRLVGEATIYALPIRPHHEVIGVLSLHQRSPMAALSSLPGAQFLADAIGAALLAEPVVLDKPIEDGPWSNRIEIDEATGMVIAQLGLAPADALAILRAHAFAHDATLNDIAKLVLSGGLDFGSETGGHL